jgi:hypothetical protein
MPKGFQKKLDASSLNRFTEKSAALKAWEVLQVITQIYNRSVNVHV